MRFTDRLALDGGIRRTGDGYAVLSARVARGGNVQAYLGAEVGVADKAIVRVYRPAEEVFRQDALRTYAGVPVTMGHPSEQVTAASWKDVAVGEVGDEVLRDGEFVRVPMMLRDAKAIAAVEAGERELSMGYEASLTMQDGVTPAGEPYDAIMGGFRMNHVAIVGQARGGHELRIGDGAAAWGAAPVSTSITDERNPVMPEATLRTVVVDGLSVMTTDQGAQAIEKITKDKAAVEQRLADAQRAHKDAIAAKDAEIVKKDEEIGALKADLKKAQDSAPKPADLDKMVADRAALVTTVKAIDAKIDPAGKSDADLRKAAVAAKLGDEFVKDASEAEIAGMFKAIAKDIKAADPFADAVKAGVKSQDGDAAVNDAYAQMVADMQSAHRPAAA